MKPCANELFVFSGTGNTLHVARLVAAGLPDATIVSLTACIREGTTVARGDSVGLFFPVYMNAIPAHLREWLEHLDVQGARYIYAVVTHCGFVNPAYLQQHLGRILARKGRRLDACFAVKMAANSPTGLTPTWMKPVKDWAAAPEKARALEGSVVEAVRGITTAVHERAGQLFPAGLFTRMLGRFFTAITKSTRNKIPFLLDPACNGCGLCERVCPSGTIVMRDGKPFRRPEKDCWYCYACFNFCPEQAILVKHYQLREGRYHHPAVSAGEIVVLGEGAADAGEKIRLV
jgi:ferredoxin